MKIIIAGGTGQIGSVLLKSFTTDGHEVVVLSRKNSSLPGCRVVFWDGVTAGAWTFELDGSDVVVNLAGRSVDCRYHGRNRDAILQSRVNSTRAIGRAISECSRPPAIWLQAGTATIYSHRFDADNDDVDGIIGGAERSLPSQWRFSVAVAQAWEAAATEHSLPHTRLVILRSAMTMSPDRGGVFDVLLRLVRWGLGGTSGTGQQFVSWVHDTDFVRAVQWIIKKESLSGPINVCSPHPLPNAEFMRVLRGKWGIRTGLPAASWMLAIGALFLRTETELILKSRRVTPRRLEESGFRFTLPHWDAAAADLCQRWRQQKRILSASVMSGSNFSVPSEDRCGSSQDQATRRPEDSDVVSSNR